MFNSLFIVNLQNFLQKYDRGEVKSLWSRYVGLHTCYNGL